MIFCATMRASLPVCVTRYVRSCFERQSLRVPANSVHPMSRTETKAGLPALAFASASDWEQWLSRQPRSSKGIWLKLAKKGARIESVSRQGAIDGALCYGWIDGQLQKFDERYWLVRFTPRSAKSKWSSINQSRIQTLIDT